jgi:hypothetical protein
MSNKNTIERMVPLMINHDLHQVLNDILYTVLNLGNRYGKSVLQMATYFICRSQNPFLFSFMTYHQIM